MGISFFVLTVIITQSQGGWNYSYPFFILMYGLGTFVSGRMLQFTPLVIGGIINWFLAIVCAFVQFDYQLLIAAAAILCSYIIPGHLIKPENK
jgi:predicted PurR-regulated permease PerM